MTWSPESISLLYPDSEHRPVAASHLTERSVEDLGLAEIAERMAGPSIGSDTVLDTLCDLHVSREVIAYRQEILADIFDIPELSEELEAVLPKITEMTWHADTRRNESSPLLQAIWRLGELELYVECVESLNAVLSRVRDRLGSEGLKRLAELLDRRRSGSDYRALTEELPKMREAVRKRKSVTIGVNLDDRLRPVEAVLVSVNEESFRQKSLLSRLFGPETTAGGFDAAAPIHATPKPQSASLYPTGAFPLAPLFQDLERLLHSLSRPVVSHIKKYVQINSDFLSAARADIAFYLGAARLMRWLSARGLPVCRPEIAPLDERTFEIEGFYNVRLALLLGERSDGDAESEMVRNDAVFDENGRIFVLTGPNQGGKTTYTQGLGIAQVFAQTGLLVPAARARISPADRVVTHFPIMETGRLEQGRFAEEASRLSSLFAEVTRHSFILLNESLSSTSPGEGLYLAEDIVSAFRLLGVRAVFATHLHELAHKIDEINAAVAGDSKLISLVAGIREASESGRNGNSEAHRTFRIVPGPPIGKSYARDIADQFGISFDRIRSSLKRRGVV